MKRHLAFAQDNDDWLATFNVIALHGQEAATAVMRVLRQSYATGAIPGASGIRWRS